MEHRELYRDSVRQGMREASLIPAFGEKPPGIAASCVLISAETSSGINGQSQVWSAYRVHDAIVDDQHQLHLFSSHA